MVIRAEAQPTKHFFVNMITRDISLEDAILDLLDNSIDAYCRLNNVDVSDNLLADNNGSKLLSFKEGSISITINSRDFSITDNCGGIDLNLAKKEIFMFGKITKNSLASLGVFGIGLKRAIFKIGKQISITSKTINNGFSLDVNTTEWLKNDDWFFSLVEKKKANSKADAGTTITISNLNDEIKTRIDDGTFFSNLYSFIASAYPLFLGRYVNILVNGKSVKPIGIPIGHSDDIEPSYHKINIDDVALTIIVGLAERSQGQWNVDKAGWYVICNGRVVVFADRSDLTGWGKQLPQFVSKYRGFIGLAFFFSKNQENLPWTTTKRGLNKDSAVFQAAKSKMQIHSRPVIAFLNNMYRSDELEEPIEREMAEKVKTVDIEKIVSKAQGDFRISKTRGINAPTVTVQYKVKKVEIDKIKKCIGKPTWSAGRIGKYALEYLVEQECSE